MCARTAMSLPFTFRRDRFRSLCNQQCLHSAKKARLHSPSGLPSTPTAIQIDTHIRVHLRHACKRLSLYFSLLSHTQRLRARVHVSESFALFAFG